MGLLTGAFDFLGLTNYGDQKEALKKADKYFKNIKVPEERQLELERLVSLGELSPEMARDITLGTSAFQDIQIDPRLKQAQLDALMGLQERAQEGLTASDKYDLARIKQDEETQARGAREAILQNAAARGVGGGGLEMLSQMQNQQESASRQAMRDQAIAAQAQEAKMQALLQSGQLGGQMRSQEYGEQADAAKARDYIDQFNVANQINTQRSNIDARNRAQEANLQARREMAQTNLGQSNQERQYNVGQGQRTFQNQLALADAKAGGQQNMAAFLGQQSKDMMGLAGAGALATGTVLAASDMRAKKDIEPADIDIDNFLNELTGYKYKYRDPQKHGQGERLGVMAQDMEKSPMGREAVVEVDGTKNLDSTKVLHSVLASVARLNERLNDMEGV